MQLSAAQCCRQDPPLEAGRAAGHPLLSVTKTGLWRTVMALLSGRNDAIELLGVVMIALPAARSALKKKWTGAGMGRVRNSHARMQAAHLRPRPC